MSSKASLNLAYFLNFTVSSIRSKLCKLPIQQVCKMTRLVGSILTCTLNAQVPVSVAQPPNARFNECLHSFIPFIGRFWTSLQFRVYLLSCDFDLIQEGSIQAPLGLHLALFLPVAFCLILFYGAASWRLFLSLLCSLPSAVSSKNGTRICVICDGFQKCLY